MRCVHCPLEDVEDEDFVTGGETVWQARHGRVKCLYHYHQASHQSQISVQGPALNKTSLRTAAQGGAWREKDGVSSRSNCISDAPSSRGSPSKRHITDDACPTSTNSAAVFTSPLPPHSASSGYPVVQHHPPSSPILSLQPRSFLIITLQSHLHPFHGRDRMRVQILLLALPTLLLAQQYELQSHFEGATFLDNFDFVRPSVLHSLGRT